MALAGKIGIGVTFSAVCSGLILFGPLDLAAAHRGASASLALLERPGCSASPHATNPPESGDSQGLSQTVTVAVPRTALFRVDHGGHIVAAMTNTGCAPRPGDDLFYVSPDGTLVAVPTSSLANRRWVGNFTTPGVYVSQSKAGHDDDSDHDD